MSIFKVKAPDRREFHRMEFHAQASVKHDNELALGEIVNISNRGAFLKLDKQFAINDMVDLTIYIKHESAKLSLTYPSKVVRIGTNGIGLNSCYLDLHKLLHLEVLLDLNKENKLQLFEEFCRYNMTH